MKGATSEIIASPPINERPSLYAWGLVAMLFPVALLNYLDRMMMATMRSSIRADIPTIANDADFGFLMALFLWVYAAFSPIGGFVADRFNRRWVVVASLFIWSTLTCLTGHATTFAQMAWARGFMGLSEACYIPAALALIADFHTGSTRSRAVGIHACGIYAGQALGGIGGYISDASSWRNAFYGFGTAGVVYAFVLTFLLRNSRTSVTEQIGQVRFPHALKALFACGGFLILAAYFTMPSTPGWAIKNWLPTFLETKFNLKQGPAGLSATGYVTLAMFAGALLGGALADRAMRATSRGRIYVSALGMAFCAPALFGLGHAQTLSFAIVCMVLFGLGFGFFDANNMPILCQIVRPEHRATGYGFMNMISVLAGAGVTYGMGAMRDKGMPLGTAFSLLAAIAALGGLLVLQLRPKVAR